MNHSFPSWRRAQPLLAALLFALLLIGAGRTPVLAQNIDRVGFFIDPDPGFGLATAAALPANPGSALTGLNISVPLGTLAPGFHALYYRTRDASGQWSQTYRRPFFLDNPAAATAPALSRLEYFVDTDPSFDLATGQVLTGPVAVGTTVAVPLGGLKAGFHARYFRSRDADG